MGAGLALAIGAVSIGSSADPAPSADPIAVTTGRGAEVGVAVADAPAVRRGATQVTPTLPPPQAQWTTGTVENCVPGELVRGVDTGDERLVTFTYDDGPDPRWTRAIMDQFERRDATATFFMIGLNMRLYPDLVREVVDRGFALGNHTVTHRYSASTIAAEVGPANDLIRSIADVRTPYFRSPGLVQGSVINDALRASGQCYLFTTVVLNDHLVPRWSAGQLCSRFLATLHPGAIVLLHDGGDHQQTALATGCMLDGAIARGYRIVSLMDLLAAGDPYSGPRPRAGHHESLEVMTE